MKNQYTKHAWTTFLAASCALWLAGCGGNQEAAHDHDHDHDADGHDHTHAEGGSTDVAATVTDASESSATTEVSYPLKTCVVSGEELGSMGEAVSYEHEGTVIRVCCDHCFGCEERPGQICHGEKAVAQPEIDPFLSDRVIALQSSGGPFLPSTYQAVSRECGYEVPGGRPPTRRRHALSRNEW